jgi:perosamine synthetase
MMTAKSEKLAIDGGIPVRKNLLPYGRQSINLEDIEAIRSVLSSDWLTTGPKISEFEQRFAELVQSKEAVAVSNGTAALHTAMYALGIQPGDEVIVPSMTFAATANCVVYQGARPVFADVNSDTLLIDPNSVEEKITPKTKAIIAVDFAGQPCDYDTLWEIANCHNLTIVDDACHALGAFYKDRPVGTLGLLNTFSFHPVKNITTGEGGMITTENPDLSKRMRLFRNHGISTDHRQREQQGSWFYEMVDLGFNYRLTDMQCALGISQLKNLPEWILRRQTIAKQYISAFRQVPCVQPLHVNADSSHAYHLFVVELDLDQLEKHDRSFIFQALRAEGIGVNVHYIPVHLHPYYQKHFSTGTGQCPVAENAYKRILSLPIFPRMTDQDIQDVIHAVDKVIQACI